ncbi:tail fiber protein [Salmonella phage SE_PL]|uniref:hypothetical protein n=1 Tax=Salmonella enterica TaxID=28901 RepID=UPI001162966B|nr:tail fiber [Salmonella phage 7t3]QIG62753.1 tail fiber protein [Salmonella phage SE_PL]
MSISFNHPKNTVTSTGSLNLIVTTGNPTSPQPIRFNATSVIMPVRALPSGEAGAMVFDTGTKTMKYHNGLSWVEMLGQDTILQPIYTEINNINQKLGTKVDSVTYNSGAVPQASISGTQLSITFPISSGGSTGSNGLFTSSKQGSIQMYALSDGMSAATIREQMSGKSGGQNGRNGSQSSPFISNDGWCFADGMWWTWEGESGTVTQRVPNLNQQAYLKPMSVSGTIQIGSVIASSAAIGGTSLTIAQLPPHSFNVSGQTDAAGDHVHTFPLSNQRSGTGWADGATPNRYDGDGRTNNGGIHIHTFQGTTNTLGSGQPHSHSISNLDVNHFNVAVIYNIATPSFALNESAANGKYVLKTGDTMTGSLTIATAATIKGNDSNLTMTWRNSSNAERAMIYHSSTNNTLRFRSNGGTEMTLNQSGVLTTSNVSATSLTVSGNSATVNGRNIVRSVNGIVADGNGNVNLPTGDAVTDVMVGDRRTAGVSESPIYPGYIMTGWAFGNKKELRGASYYTAPLMIFVNGSWRNVAYK